MIRFIFTITLMFPCFFHVAQAELYWIWSSNKPKNEKAVFQRSFTINGTFNKSYLEMSCDNQAKLSINHQLVTETISWQVPKKINVKKYLKQGENTIVVHCQNEGPMAGLLLRLKIHQAKQVMKIETNDSWQTKVNEQWKPAVHQAKYGDKPWGKILSPKPIHYDIKTLAGFDVERLYVVPKSEQGSWVGMSSDGKGRLITCDQHGALYRVTLGKEVQVEKLKTNIGKAHGILYAFDSLYVLVNETKDQNGLYRLRDSNGDDQFDQQELLLKIKSGSEHGIHSLVLSPDKQSMVLIAGNYSFIPDQVKLSNPTRQWGEDHLLPRMPDGRGHATGRLAPGGFILRLDPEAKHPRLICYGFRNPFDAAFNAEGDLFTYDADMEYDLGSPWYRPTRVNHIISGADYGWRYGTGKYPEYYADSLPATHNIGPGCPTGVSNGLGAKFPEKYQKALYVNDWTYGTMYAIHLKPQGATYMAEREEFISGKPLPLTDVIIHSDGHMYFLIGGRHTQSALFRVRYKGEDSIAPMKQPMIRMEHQIRRSLEKYHELEPNVQIVAEVWPYLAHSDRSIRHVARVALEKQNIKQWKERLYSEQDPWTIIEGSIAMARVGDKQEQEHLIRQLLTLDMAKLKGQQLLSALRAYQLVFTRLGTPNDTMKEKVVKQLNLLYPHIDNFANRELAQILLYLDAPGAVSKTVEIVVSAVEVQEKLIDAKVLARNDNYRAAAEATTRYRPNTQQMALAFALRSIKKGWSEADRLTYFSWFPRARAWRGGNSYSIFIDKMRKEALANVEAPLLRQKLEKRSTMRNVKVRPIQPPEGPGRQWTLESAYAAVNKHLKFRNFKRGENLFHASACSSCHRFAGDGNGIGPDITASASRYTLRDMLENIIEPSKVISDQYASTKLSLNDGSEILGRIGTEEKGNIHVMTNPFSADSTVKVKLEAIKHKEKWPISPMPAGLINALNEDELRDLVAYIFSGGDKQHDYFKPAKDKHGMISLFNGQNLDGWKGDNKLWKVENGVIVGSTHGHPLNRNTFLIWEGDDLKNFHLKMDAKVEGNNSGIMYRSYLNNKFKYSLSGYQADIHPNQPYVGMLYGEGLGRGIIGERGRDVHVQKNGEKRIRKKGKYEKVDVSKWQSYEIICRDNVLIHKVNGKVALECIDDHPKRLMKGLIGMQLHAGAPMKVWFKNIKLRRLE